jgi:uncharacterized damage-inducible protein DinB
MTVDQLHSLVAYNRWANTRLLEATAALDAEERERDVRASFGSLQGTLVHILWGEHGWLRFWQEGADMPPPGPDDYPDFASLRSAWSDHEGVYEAYLHGLKQADLDGPRPLNTMTYRLGELVQHALNHSTFHRGQVVLLLRQLGHVPPSTDYDEYLAEARGAGGG